MEMKACMKTIGEEFDLDYEKTFASSDNLRIRRRLVPELQKSLSPRYKASVRQLNSWLSSLHKSRRATSRMRRSGTLAKDLRRTHANNRLNDVQVFPFFFVFPFFLLLFHYITDILFNLEKNSPN
jgi:hypothetical protein